MLLTRAAPLTFALVALHLAALAHFPRSAAAGGVQGGALAYPGGGIAPTRAEADSDADAHWQAALAEADHPLHTDATPVAMLETRERWGRRRRRRRRRSIRTVRRRRVIRGGNLVVRGKGRVTFGTSAAAAAAAAAARRARLDAERRRRAAEQERLRRLRASDALRHREALAAARSRAALEAARRSRARRERAALEAARRKAAEAAARLRRDREMARRVAAHNARVSGLLGRAGRSERRRAEAERKALERQRAAERSAAEARAAALRAAAEAKRRKASELRAAAAAGKARAAALRAGNAERREKEAKYKLAQMAARMARERFETARRAAGRRAANLAKLRDAARKAAGLRSNLSASRRRAEALRAKLAAEKSAGARRLSDANSRLRKEKAASALAAARARAMRRKLTGRANALVSWINSPRRSNCQNPTLVKDRHGKWVPKRRTWAVRKMTHTKRGWFSSPSLKYRWLNCNWVLDSVWVEKSRARARAQLASKRAYKGLVAAQNMATSKIVSITRRKRLLEKRNKYLEAVAGADRKRQVKTMAALVRARAKKEFARFAKRFTDNYLRSGKPNAPGNGGVFGGAKARIPGGDPNVFGTPTQRELRFDPQPGPSVEQFHGSNEPSDDVAPVGSASISDPSLSAQG